MERASKNLIKSLKKQKRENKSLLFLDNVKIIKDALAKHSILPFCILTSLDEAEFQALNILPNNLDADFALETAKNVDEIIKQIDSEVALHKPAILYCSEGDIQQLAGTTTPQKVLCIAYHTQYIVEVPKTNFLVLDGLQDPGNVGTLIRTAKASGFEYVFLVDSVRKNNDKLIRSSAGAVLDSKVYEMSRAEFVNFAKEHSLCLICCDMSGENIFTFSQTDVCPNKNAKGKGAKILGVVVGNEGQGVSDSIRLLCYKTVKIPMKDGIESLNAGVSGSIIMYEINKNQF